MNGQCGDHFTASSSCSQTGIYSNTKVQKNKKKITMWFCMFLHLYFFHSLRSCQLIRNIKMQLCGVIFIFWIVKTPCLYGWPPVRSAAHSTLHQHLIDSFNSVQTVSSEDAYRGNVPSVCVCVCVDLEKSADAFQFRLLSLRGKPNITQHSCRWPVE